MRGLWKGIGCLTLLLGIGGCATDPNRPPPRPDELVDVPDDKKYQEPPVPPKTNNPDDNPLRQNQPANPNGGTPRSPNRPGAPGGPSSSSSGY